MIPNQGLTYKLVENRACSSKRESNAEGSTFDKLKLRFGRKPLSIKLHVNTTRCEHPACKGLGKCFILRRSWFKRSALELSLGMTPIRPSHDPTKFQPISPWLRMPKGAGYQGRRRPPPRRRLRRSNSLPRPQPYKQSPGAHLWSAPARR